jgi:mRNA interferase MazF
MANGYFERGEVYWVRVDSGFGVETGVGRPGLIISNNRCNNGGDAVNIAWLTTQTKTEPWDVMTYATGKRSFVMCNQILTVDKSRLGKCIGELPPEDMKKVEDALEDQLDLGYVDDTALKKKDLEIRSLHVQMDELRAEIAKLKAEIEAKEDNDVATKVEIEMWQRLYGKALDQVVAMKLTGDVARRVEEPKSADRKVVKKKTEKKSEDVNTEADENTLTDVNTASFQELKACGLSNNLILQVIDKRPYKSLNDVKKLPGFTNVMWQIISKKICCVPVKVEEPEKVEEPVKVEEPEKVKEPKPKKEKVVWDGVKVNVNKVETVAELRRRTGMSQRTATDVIKHREQFGDYEKLDDLTNLEHFGATCMKRYGHMLEV